jgi:hypothetical protein
MWWCQCTCVDRTKSLRSGRNLRRKHGKSCGCLRREAAAERAKRPRLPCISKMPEYRTWKNMSHRCKDPQNNRFKYYGARGIRVCERWDRDRGIETFWNFLADMGLRPGPKCTIDRIDNDGDYEPKNCHWVPPTPQSRNRRCVRKVEYAGGTISTVELAEELAGSSQSRDDDRRGGQSTKRHALHAGVSKMSSAYEPRLSHAPPSNLWIEPPSSSKKRSCNGWQHARAPTRRTEMILFNRLTYIDTLKRAGVADDHARAHAGGALAGAHSFRQGRVRRT